MEALIETAEWPQLGPVKQREDIWFGNRKQITIENILHFVHSILMLLVMTAVQGR